MCVRTSYGKTTSQTCDQFLDNNTSAKKQLEYAKIIKI